MAEQARKSRSNLGLFCWITGCFLLAALFALWYLNSASFHARIRRALIAELESITGGTVDLGRFQWSLARLEVEAGDLTIHGREAPGELPYAHIDDLRARLNLRSLFERRILLRELSLVRPVVHVIVYADGHTNQPRPKRLGQGSNSVQPLFALSLRRFQLREGWLVWSEHRIPLDVSARDVSLDMTYTAAAHSYEASLRAENIEIGVEKYGPVSCSARAEISIFSDHALVKSFEVASGRSRLQASGSLSNWNHMIGTASYRLYTDLPEIAGLLRLQQARAGKVEVNGKAVYSNNSLVSTGQATFKGVAWTEQSVSVKGVSGELDFSLTPDRITISRLFASLLGGSVTGQAEMRNWRSLSPDVTLMQRRGRTQPAEAAMAAVFTVHALSVRELASAFATRNVPLQRLNVVGDVNGDVALDRCGSTNSTEAKLNLSVSPPPTIAPGQLPVTARIQGSYFHAREVLELTTLSAATSATHLQASGAMGSSAANLRFTISTSNLTEFQPLLEQLPGARPMPVELAGKASFAGTAAGRWSTPAVAGHLEVEDFSTLLPRPPQQGQTQQAAAKPRRGRIFQRLLLSPFRAPLSAPAPPAGPVPPRIHWDALSADVFYSPNLASIHHAVLRRGRTQLELDATSSLFRGEFTDLSQLHLRLQVRGGELTDLQSIAGTNYQVTGKLQTSFEISGTRRELSGRGHLVLLGVVAYGEPIRSVDADLQLQGKRVQLRNLVLLGSPGEVTGEGAYEAANREFSFALRGASLRLDQVRQLHSGRVRVAGSLSFEAQGSGTPEAPVMNAALHLRDLAVNGDRIGDFDADAVTRGESLALNARSKFRNGLLTLEGGIQLRGEMPMSLTLVANQLVLDPLLRNLLPAGHAGHALLDGQMQVHGPARTPRLLTAEVQIPRFVAELEGLPARNVGPIRLHMANQVVSVDQLRLEGQATHYVEVHGQVNVSGDRQLDLEATGKVDLRLLQTLDPSVVSGGVSEFEVRVRGTAAKPSLRGQVRIVNGGISYVDLANGLSNINGALVFTQDRLQVQQLTARTGGGQLSLGGFISYTQGLAFHLTASGNDIRLRYPDGVSSSVDTDLSLSGSTNNALLSGNVTVRRLALNPQFDFALYLNKSRQVTATLNSGSPANTVKLDVRVVSTPQLQVQTSLARVTGNVDLHLRGTLARPSVLGRINILEGNITIAGTTYHLDRGDVTFMNPVSNDPNVDIEGSARVRDYDITLGLQGTPSHMGLTYRSDPPLSSSDIISLLALGRTREEEVNLTPGSSTQGAAANYSESASNAILGQALSSLTNSRVQRLFGVSRIKIDPQVGGPQNGANARLTIEQPVSNAVTLTYITNLAQSAQEIIQFEYYLTRSISIVGVRDQNGVVGFDLFVRHRRR